MIVATVTRIILKLGFTVITLLVINGLGAAYSPVISKFYRYRADAVVICHVLLSLPKEDTPEARCWTNSTSAGLTGSPFRLLVQKYFLSPWYLSLAPLPEGGRLWL